MKKLNCILLVDDNIDDNFFHTIVINEAGAAEHVHVATTGERALSYLEKSVSGDKEFPIPDLVFLDINMPGMNGFEFVQAAKDKKLINGKPAVFVMLTSSMNPNDDKIAHEKFPGEIKEFRTKPLTGEMLKEIIERYF